MTLPKLIKWECYGDLIVTGCGEEIELTVNVTRKRKKIGDYEQSRLALTLPRWFVYRLQKQLAEMHARDLARIDRQRKRIADEVTAINTRP